MKEIWLNMNQDIIDTLLTKDFQKSIQNYMTLNFEFGQFKSIQQQECVDKMNQAIPWYTYPAIEYIKQLDFSSKRIFEYGSGNSSVFWSKRCLFLVSVEDNQEWYNKIKPKLPYNTEYNFFEDKERYANHILNFEEKFDVIIIDGKHRYECAVASKNKIKDNGLIILDNSDWFEKTAQYLRSLNTIQADMAGFGPINPYTWTTSFFFTRKFDFPLAGDRQPMHGIGSLPHREQ